MRKKIISVITVLCLLLNCFAVAASAKETYVVNIYLCARQTVSPFGHLWVYFENISRNNVKVGAYLLEPGKGVSVGTWGSKGKDGVGVYYNVEAYSASHYGISGIISAKDSLTEAELEAVSAEIKDTNRWEPFIMNCMGFAFHIWNINCRPFLVPMMFPFIGRLQMLTLCDTSRNLKMYSPKSSEVYRQIRKGDTIQHVSAEMLEKIL